MVRTHPDPPPSEIKRHRGAIAQLGERLLCKQEVIGSIPIGSTSELPGRMAQRTRGISNQFRAREADWCFFAEACETIGCSLTIWDRR